MPDADVVVAGAGPAGAITAMLLARQGYHVMLLDRARFPRHKACAEYMSPGVVETLRRIGIVDSIGALGPERVPGMDIVSPRAKIFSVTYGTGLDGPTAWTLPRLIFDAALVEQARTAGVEVRENFVARAVDRQDGAVRGISGTWRGEPARIVARLTVISDGSRSKLSRDLGLSRSPRWPVRLGLVAHFEGRVELNGKRGQMHVGHGGYCGVAPLPGGVLNVAVVTKLDALQRTGLTATEYFERWIARHPRLRALLHECERVTAVRGVGPIGSRSSRSWLPGCVLVGDASSFFDPFTGEGMFRALRGAELAACVGDAALREGKADGRCLAPYEVLRRSAFLNKSCVTTLVQLFVQYPRLMEYALPRLSRRAGAAEALNLVLGDVRDAQTFLNPRTLWATLRP